MQEPICNGCCCFSLRTGGLIIGWLNALIGLFGLIITISFLGYKLQEYSDETFVNLHNFYGLRYVDKSAFVVMAMIIALIFLVEGISGLLLIIGIIQYQHKKMIMYMVVSFIGIVIEFIGLFSSANTTREVIKELVGISFQIYYLCIIYSLYVVIKYRLQLRRRPSYPIDDV